MKHAITNFLLSAEVQASLLAQPLRALVRATQSFYNFSPLFLTYFQVVERPHYAYCMLKAADLAKRLGLTRISAIEFGVAGGNGLAFMADFAKQIEPVVGVTIDCHGFDTGKGMPRPEGNQDLPYWFQAGQYVMDQDKLRKRLPDTNLVIGNIRETVESFVSSHQPAPIGVVFNDTDYCSSTAQSLRLFETSRTHPQHFLPRIFNYFDDIVGTELEMFGPFNGQLAAIENFNATHADMKIHRNQNLLRENHWAWRHQIYYCHLFEHPDYGRYVGGAQQESLVAQLRLSET